MSYSYNKWKFKEFAEATGKTHGQIGRMVGVTNSETTEKWINGGVPNIGTIVKFANAAQISILEFFYENGTLMSELYSKSKNGTDQEHISNSIDSIIHIREISNLEKKHIKEMMQKDIDLARQEAKMREEIRRELKAEFEQDKQTLVDNYEARLRSRDADVAKLQQQLAELTLQYKELESKTEKGYMPYGTVTGVADKPYGMK